MPEAPTPERKHIITINGYLGSGKSTAMKGLAAQLGYTSFSSGDYFRELSSQQGLDLLSGNKAAEEDTSFDDAVDAKVKELGETQDRIVIDSRMAWFWIPNSFKVYLKLNSLVAAERILEKKNQRRADTEHIPADPVAYAAELDARRASELRRYKELYGADPSDESNYSQVIDTTYTTPSEVKLLITKEYRQFLNS